MITYRGSSSTKLRLQFYRLISLKSLILHFFGGTSLLWGSSSSLKSSGSVQISKKSPDSLSHHCTHSWRGFWCPICMKDVSKNLFCLIQILFLHHGSGLLKRSAGNQTPLPGRDGDIDFIRLTCSQQDTEGAVVLIVFA